MNPQFAQIAPPTELSVLLSFQIRVARLDRRHDAVPAVALDRDRGAEPDRELLLLRPRTGAATLDLLPPLEHVAIGVRAEVGAVDLTIDEVLALAAGRRDPPRRADRATASRSTPATADLPRDARSHRRHLAVQVHDRVARLEEAAAEPRRDDDAEVAP